MVTKYQDTFEEENKVFMQKNRMYQTKCSLGFHNR